MATKEEILRSIDLIDQMIRRPSLKLCRAISQLYQDVENCLVDKEPFDEDIDIMNK